MPSDFSDMQRSVYYFVNHPIATRASYSPIDSKIHFHTPNAGKLTRELSLISAMSLLVHSHSLPPVMTNSKICRLFISHAQNYFFLGTISKI